MDVETFVEKCKDVLARRGEDVAHGIVMGYCGVPCRQYTDEKMTISTATVSGKNHFEIKVTYMTKTHEGKEYEISNPCIMVIDDKMIRYHGDWRRAVAHVETL